MAKTRQLAMAMLLFGAGILGADAADLPQDPLWLRVSSDLAAMHYLPGQVGWIGLKTQHPYLLWLWPTGTPMALKNLTPGTPSSPLLLGALDYFAYVHDLPWSNSSLLWDDQRNRRRLYAAIRSALRQGEQAPQAFVWVYVRKSEPETLRIWEYDPREDTGHWVLQSLANTGIRGAVTPTGTWPVYARYASTRMTGCFSHGECYNDADVRYVNYFWDGRAVHFFPRTSYGFPQSNGCVELPFTAAKKAFALIHIGTPVTVAP
ncbi:L,D-transpeptidase [Acidithiobacillus sp. MC6.1]|nr:L,D-transpeptidase [Acidithiobacillus sp. MC6.1]